MKSEIKIHFTSEDGPHVSINTSARRSPYLILIQGRNYFNYYEQKDYNKILVGLYYNKQKDYQNALKYYSFAVKKVTYMR